MPATKMFTWPPPAGDGCDHVCRPYAVSGPNWTETVASFGIVIEYCTTCEFWVAKVWPGTTTPTSAGEEEDVFPATDAVTATVSELCAFGAVYTPDESIVPTDAFPPTEPFTDQTTDVALVPFSAALNCTLWPVITVAEPGVIVSAARVPGELG